MSREKERRVELDKVDAALQALQALQALKGVLTDEQYKQATAPLLKKRAEIQSRLAGSGAVAQGNGATAAGAGGVAVGWW